MKRFTLSSILLLVLGIAAPAVAQDFNPISISLVNGTSCSQATVELALLATGISKESYRISASGGEFDYTSPAFAAANSQVNGSTTRSITFPSAAKATSLIGIAYKVGGGNLDDDTHAEFFAAFSCSNGANAQALYTCVGRKGVCPQSIGEYLPHGALGDYSDSGDFGTISDRERHEGHFELRNDGFVSLAIASAEIEGETPEPFKLISDVPLPLYIDAHSSWYFSIKFQTRRIGDFSARLRIKSGNPAIADTVIPLLASTKALPALKVHFDSLGVSTIGKQKAITGRMIVNNFGLAPSRPGARAEVVMVGSESAGDKSAPRKVLSVTLPALKPGEKRTFFFSSKNHDFSKTLDKIFNAEIFGNKKQRGAAEYRTSFKSSYYLYYNPRTN